MAGYGTEMLAGDDGDGWKKTTTISFRRQKGKVARTVQNRQKSREARPKRLVYSDLPEPWWLNRSLCAGRMKLRCVGELAGGERAARHVQPAAHADGKRTRMAKRAELTGRT